MESYSDWRNVVRWQRGKAATADGVDLPVEHIRLALHATSK